MSAAGRVLYAEVPGFYAAVARADDPALRARPVIVGGDPRKRGRVQSASPEALACGVAPGMPMLEALERCPRARAVRTDMRRYREVAGLLRAVLRAEVERLEPVGLDAAVLDASRDPRAVHEIASRLCERVKRELAMALRVGAAGGRAVARIAAGRAEPGGCVIVEPGGEAAFLAPLPVDVLPGVGPRTSDALRGLGVKRVGDLLRVERAALEAQLGNHGLELRELARGADRQPVRAAAAPRSVSREHTFEHEQVDLASIRDEIVRLAEALEAPLRRQGLGARRVALKLRWADHETTTRTRTLEAPVRSAAAISAAALALLDRTPAGTRPLRLVGLRLGGLGSEAASDRQLELFGDAPAD